MTAGIPRTVADLEARIDKLTHALLHVAGELWATRDRQAVLEKLLTDSGSAVPGLIDDYRPDSALAEALAAEREAFIASILTYLVPEE